jgi:hypothetical protein
VSNLFSAVDWAKSQVPVLARYKLIADEYKFSPIWISGSTMIADAFSRLCIIPEDKHIVEIGRLPSDPSGPNGPGDPGEDSEMDWEVLEEPNPRH